MMDVDTASRAEATAHKLLREERFAEAWPLFEGRRWSRGTSTKEPMADYPEWLGEDLAGKHIMVVAEQGFGDQIMFGRYLSALSERAGKVTILCHPWVWMLFGELGYTGHPYFVNQQAPPADYWVLFGSLPLRLGMPSPPSPVYLPFSGSGRGVGIMTSGSPTNINDMNRSLPSSEADRLRAMGIDLAPSATGARSFLDTAKIIADLDLVITVDTSVAHLAGSMGKTCWVLLPYRGLDWRWGYGVSSPWYRSMRLLRQPQPGDWSTVLSSVSKQLAEI